jgi:hypothetical protein
MDGKYTYEVTPRPPALGGGWRLQLLEDGEEVGGGVFPLAWADEPQQGVDWWNAMSEETRAFWLGQAKSAVPADAWQAYLTQEAMGDAVEVAEDWLSTRPQTDANPLSR